MTVRYMKDKKTGLVIDTTADYGKYMQEKNNIKALAKTNKEIDKTKNELSIIKLELTEIKDMMKQLLTKGT